MKTHDVWTKTGSTTRATCQSTLPDSLLEGYMINMLQCLHMNSEAKLRNEKESGEILIMKEAVQQAKS
jgi:hypothetical protein